METNKTEKPEKPPDKPKSKAGRKRRIVPRMTIIQTPVVMQFD